MAAKRLVLDGKPLTLESRCQRSTVRSKITSFPGCKSGRGTPAVYKIIRKHVKHMDQDRELHQDIESIVNLMSDGSILKFVERAAGQLH